MRRAMTLLEVVLALALLAGVAFAATSWTTLTARAADQLADESAWSLAAASVFGLIGEDISCCDPLHDGERVEIDGGSLSIRTRDGQGPAIHVISQRDDRLVLVRIAHASQPHVESLLLDRVARFEVSSDETPDGRMLLTALIQRDDGVVIQKRWVVR
jgi:type II secretory pathway component PulJ